MRTRAIVPLLLLVAILATVGRLPEQVGSVVWSPEEEISTDFGTENQIYPSIAAEGGRVHIVWQDEGDGDADIMHRLFNGVSWQPEEEISTDVLNEDQGWPRIALEGDEPHVVWADEGDGDPDVYYRHFNGTSWEPEMEISTDSGNEVNAVPSIAVENGEVHIVWHDESDGDSDIYYRHFNGSDWEPELEISSDLGTENQTFPAIAVENGRIHVVWMNRADGDFDIYYRLHDGIDWQPEEEISVDTESETQGNPRIAAEAGDVHAVWSFSSLTGDVHIYHRHFDGSVWLPERMVNVERVGTFDFQFWPDVAVDMGKAYVVWQDGQVLVDFPFAENDIHLRVLHGDEWTPEMEVSSDIGTEMQAHASVAVENGTAYMVWQDMGDDDSDIYFRRGEHFIPPESEAIPPQQYWHRSSLVDIGWTASDDLNLAEVSLFYRHSTDNSSWSDWDVFSTNDSISGTSSSGSFSFDVPDGDGYYEIYSVAKDVHDNLEMSPQAADTRVGVDTSNPTIVAIEPADESTDVQVEASIEITFSEGMDETATNDAFSLMGNGSAVDGTIVWSSDSMTLTFHPAEDLDEGKTYQITVEASAGDVAGNGLTSTSETSFETRKSGEEQSFLDLYWWILVLVAIVLIVLTLIAWRMRRRPGPDFETLEEESTH
ncbi:MAG: hypothetical protein E3J35_08490 [Methanomassiliicoccales archaeon]|nr:MAG: hypothetical protein E3J35_08490 [Methanomassiliicoccales archaeon]